MRTSKIRDLLVAKETDSKTTIISKGMAKGLVGATLVIGSLIGVLTIVGKYVNNEDEMTAFEEEFGED
jgi:hypothetical protein